MNIDEWFSNLRKKHAAQRQCGKGCTACCYGLFAITLADAVQVAKGFSELPEDVQKRVHSRAGAASGVLPSGRRSDDRYPRRIIRRLVRAEFQGWHIRQREVRPAIGLQPHRHAPGDALG
jgi:hypothetical protein